MPNERYARQQVRHLAGYIRLVPPGLGEDAVDAAKRMLEQQRSAGESGGWGGFWGALFVIASLGAIGTHFYHTKAKPWFKDDTKALKYRAAWKAERKRRDKADEEYEKMRQKYESTKLTKDVWE